MRIVTKLFLEPQAKSAVISARNIHIPSSSQINKFQVFLRVDGKSAVFFPFDPSLRPFQSEA
jgi:hypothetical protein